MGYPEIATQAEAWMAQHGHVSHDTIDCSHFVTQVLQAVLGSGFKYMRADDFMHSRSFTTVVGNPERGDLVHWPGHIAIVLDGAKGDFIGSQTSSGVDTSNWMTDPYWSHRSHRTFLRYNGM